MEALLHPQHEAASVRFSEDALTDYANPSWHLRVSDRAYRLTRYGHTTIASQLMRSCSQNDYERALVQSYSRILRYFKRTMPHEAEDLAGEVLLAAWRAGRNFRGDASVDTLAFRISLRVLSRRRRQLKRAHAIEIELERGGGEHAAMNLDISTVDEKSPADGTTVSVRAAMSKLAPPLAQVMELFYVEGRTQREISEMLGLAPGTVASRLRRAKDQLRAELVQLESGRAHQPE